MWVVIPRSPKPLTSMSTSIVDDRPLRRYITQKWGLYAFYTSLVVFLLVIVFNSLISPKINNPDQRILLRRKLARLPWLQLGMAAWTSAITIMALIETHGSLVWVAKRTGRFAVALMPAMYILTLRPSPLPRTFYLQVLPMHKWLSRLVVVLAIIHGISYAMVYERAGTPWKLKLGYNIAGYIALICFIATAITAFYWYRRRSYMVFYSIHIITAWGCLPLLWYHSRPPCDNYLLCCLGALLYQVAFRWMRSTHTRLRVQAVSETLVVISIPKTQLPKKLQRWSPGAHFRIGESLWNPITWLQASHPYTVSSLDTDSQLQMVVRKGNFRISMRKQYSIGGPHRCFPVYLNEQLKEGQVKRALFVIGGSGIAFGAPVLRYLRMYGVQVKMVWAIRDPLDAKVLPLVGLHEDVLEHRVEIYYSGQRLVDDEDEDEDLEISTSENCCQDETEPLLFGGNKKSRKFSSDPVLKQYSNFMWNSRAHLNLRLKSWLYGLSPDNDDCCCADRLIEVSAESKKGVWVISTGHPKLVQDAKFWAGNADVSFFEEEFTL